MMNDDDKNEASLFSLCGGRETLTFDVVRDFERFFLTTTT